MYYGCLLKLLLFNLEAHMERRLLLLLYAALLGLLTIVVLYAVVLGLRLVETECVLGGALLVWSPRVT